MQQRSKSWLFGHKEHNLLYGIENVSDSLLKYDSTTQVTEYLWTYAENHVGWATGA